MWQYTLIGGPQDGAKVILYDDIASIFVGPKWLGDGYVAYGSEPCDRFPIAYAKSGAHTMAYMGRVRRLQFDPETMEYDQ